MVATTGVYALILMMYGNPETGVILAGYFGLLLLATAFVAVGVLTSSFTENQIIAAVTCLVSLLLLYIISLPADSAGERARSSIRRSPSISRRW
jgi:ABC-2 type transport system permease protein